MSEKKEKILGYMTQPEDRVKLIQYLNCSVSMAHG